MFGSLKEITPGTVLHTDVCIIGGGIAGISLARSFLDTSYEVCLLESGGLDYEPDIQDMAGGDSVGFQYYPLIDSRLRFFGGTTTIWGGRSALLDEIDFVHRPWVAHSGWPITREQLQPWYEHARTGMGLGTHSTDEALWPQLNLSRVAFDPGRIRTAFWQFDDRHSPYSAHHCNDVRNSNNVRIITHATVSHIQAASNGQEIREVQVSTPEGQRLRVRARYFVVAAGGLENARLLLAANDVHANGLGNHSDCLGRYFMEHPHARGGRIHSPQSWRLLNLFARSHRFQKHRVAASLRPGERLQEEAGILNTSFTLACRQHPAERMFFGMRAYQTLKHQLNPTKSNRRLWLATKRAAVWLHEHIDPLRPWLLEKTGRRGIYAVVRAEQAPNPASRVYLGTERDAVGMPRLVLDWRFSAQDKHSVRVTMQAFDQELKRLGLGRVELAEWLKDESTEWEVDPLISSHAIGGYHHMGTTRMSADPRHGVVDAECRVHGLDNLYVAGSSVFPTSGWANPTLSLVALSLRMGFHLKNRLERGESEHNPSRTEKSQAARIATRVD